MVGGVEDVVESAPAAIADNQNAAAAQVAKLGTPQAGRSEARWLHGQDRGRLLTQKIVIAGSAHGGAHIVMIVIGAMAGPSMQRRIDLDERLLDPAQPARDMIVENMRAESQIDSREKLERDQIRGHLEARLEAAGERGTGGGVDVARTTFESMSRSSMTADAQRSATRWISSAGCSLIAPSPSQPRACSWRVSSCNTHARLADSLNDVARHRPRGDRARGRDRIGRRYWWLLWHPGLACGFDQRSRRQDQRRRSAVRSRCDRRPPSTSQQPGRGSAAAVLHTPRCASSGKHAQLVSPLRRSYSAPNESQASGEQTKGRARTRGHDTREARRLARRHDFGYAWPNKLGISCNNAFSK
jgi:hypothetical protein